MILQSQIKEIGKFQKTHALRGELNAIFGLDPEFLEEGYPIVVDMDGIFVPFFADSVRPKGATTDLIKLQDVDSEEKARTFVNKTIYVLRSDMARFLDIDPEELDDDEEVIGYRVMDETGEELGTVADFDTSTPNHLLILDTPGGELMVPWAEEFVRDIDDDAKTLTVTLPEGLADINSAPAEYDGDDSGDTDQ